MQVPTLLSVSVNPTSVTGGAASTGTISVYGLGYTFISLSSSNPAVQVPSNVGVGGNTTTTFPITTSAVSSPVTVTITATESFAQYPPRNSIVQTATLTVNPVPSNTSLSSLTLNLFSLKAGDACSGAVQISGASSVPTTISLASSDPSVIVPGSITVLANQTLATFNVTTNTIDPIQAVITASYNGTSQSATLNALPAIDLYAVATGSSKATLYWTGVSGVNGYNIFRSLKEAGPYTEINASPITTSDPGPGLANRYMYSDAGLTTGTEYFYYVTSVTGSATSNDDSAIPSSDAISWDSGDASLIVSQVRNMASANLTEDEPAVGLLTIAGPDGVIYKGFTDDTPAAAYASPGYFDSNAGTFVYGDGTVVPAPPDAPNDNFVGLSGSAAQQPMSEVPAANTVCPLQAQTLNKTYTPTVRYGGILREVQAQAGFRGFASTILLPNPTITGPSGSTYLDGRDKGRSVFSTDDTGYVYTGGTAYQVHHRRGSGASYVDIGEIDAGLELFMTADPMRPGYLPYASQPGTTHATFNNEILGDPLADSSSSASLPYYQGPYVYVLGQPLMTFKVAGYGSVPDKTILLSFHQADNGLIFTYNKQTKMRQYVNDVTYVDGAEKGWTKSACIVIKRMNTIAQGFKKSPTPPYAYINPPDGPGGQFRKSGSYFLNVDWGDPSDTLALDGVNLLGFGQWSSDPSVTWTEGSYPSPNTPSPGNPYVGKLVQNAFSWEQYVNLKTKP